jgi:hypothetical protein
MSVSQVASNLTEEERERLLNLFDKFSLGMYLRLREATIKEIGSKQNASTGWYSFEWHDLFNFVYFTNEALKLMQTNEDFRRIFVYIRNVWVNRVYEVVVAIPKEMIPKETLA